ncbi:MAG: CDP-alcohol phosphatidyltransferase family protein [Candidatus Nanopelagicales bacterium]|nr:CDP-alcohol phosphatidyltransferase family protein [Candidatus Nanopelagicales bacterium]
MLNDTNARSVMAHVIDPVAKGLLKVGLSPDAITVIGTMGVSAGALIFFTRGSFWIGTLVIAAFIFSDMLDGTMARIAGRSGPWGAFLDSTLDRVADGAIFAALLIWFARTNQWWLVAITTVCLIGGAVVSYAKARAEGLGMTCNVGFAERTERILIVLVPTFIAGLGVPYIQAVALWLLAGLTILTVFQRMVHVYRQANSTEATA